MKKNNLSLYRNMLKAGLAFKDYNFRCYILRRTKEVFNFIPKYIK